MRGHLCSTNPDTLKRLAYWFLSLWIVSCTADQKPTYVIRETKLESGLISSERQTLSEWNLFHLPLKELQPKEGVISYSLNTPLFSDYARKARFVKVPQGESAGYSDAEVMDFPKGSILVKHFFYDEEVILKSRRIIETRLLVLEGAEWKALTYVWNDEQTEAYLEIAGKSVPVEWKDDNGVVRNVAYSVPNQVQCKSCHELNGQMSPIGPTARQLNRKEGGINQLQKWESLGILTSLPPVDKWPVVPIWDDPNTGTLDQRARAWLEINCAHCHRAEGPAKNTGLYLRYDESDDYRLGINKPPVAAGRGSGGLKYGIVKGKPNESILFHRIHSLDPGVMMPEVGRKLRHEEGLDLIRTWIRSM